jgi:hypothetical protein
MGSDAFSKLKDLSEWLFESKEFQEEQKNLARCVDENRHAKVQPLLKQLGLNQEVLSNALHVEVL